MVVNRRNRLYHVPVDAAVRASDYIPAALLPSTPSWVNEITWRPQA